MNTADDTTLDWPSIVLNQKGMKIIESLAARRFNYGALAEESTTFVIEYLSANDWKRCYAFKGQSNPYTFLHSLAHNSLEEFSRKRFGRPRPPSWLQQQGELWVRIWKYICLERQAKTQVIDTLCRDDLREPQLVESIMRTIKARLPNCGQMTGDHSTVEDIYSLSDSTDSGNTNEEHSYTNEQQLHSEILLMLRTLASDDNNTDALSDDAIAADVSPKATNMDNAPDAISSQQQQLRHELALSNEERIILKMIYLDGLPKTTVSKALGIPEYQSGRIANKALKRITTVLTKYNIHLESLLDKI